MSGLNYLPVVLITPGPDGAAFEGGSVQNRELMSHVDRKYVSDVNGLVKMINGIRMRIDNTGLVTYAGVLGNLMVLRFPNVIELVHSDFANTPFFKEDVAKYRVMLPPNPTYGTFQGQGAVI